jgi:hypothetical protein
MAPLQLSGHRLNWLNGCLQNLNLRTSWRELAIHILKIVPIT